MKLNFLLLLIPPILICTFAFGQTKYIQNYEGEIMDTLAYAKLKEKQIEMIKRKDYIVIIKDRFQEVRRTQDSIIYTYKWELKIHDAKTKEHKKFGYEDYVNKEFPLPTLKTLDHKEISINDLKGKPTLINIWSTTCKPCVDEMPTLNNIKTQFGDSINFIAITPESVQKVTEFYKTHEFNFIQIANAQKFIRSLNMDGLPRNIFLDKNGVVKETEYGIRYVNDENKKLKIGDGKEFLTILRGLL